MTVESKLARLLFADDGSVGQRVIIHNPVRVHLLPQRITLPRYVIVHPILVKMTLQPALHRVTMEMREWEARPVRYLLTYHTIYLRTYKEYILPGTISDDMEGSPVYHRTTQIPQHTPTNNVAHNIATT